MTSLLPNVVLEAVRAKSALAASGSFGLVALGLLLMMLLALESARAYTRESGRRRTLLAMAGPLFVAVAVVIGARIVAFSP